MSALGQKQTFALQKDMSALPPKRTCAVHQRMSAKGQKRTWQNGKILHGSVAFIILNP